MLLCKGPKRGILNENGWFAAWCAFLFFENSCSVFVLRSCSGAAGFGVVVMLASEPPQRLSAWTSRTSVALSSASFAARSPFSCSSCASVDLMLRRLLAASCRFRCTRAAFSTVVVSTNELVTRCAGSASAGRSRRRARFLAMAGRGPLRSAWAHEHGAKTEPEQERRSSDSLCRRLRVRQGAEVVGAELHRRLRSWMMLCGVDGAWPGPGLCLGVCAS